MATDVDAQFHRAVDIVQSLPKGGPVQTSYEEKLWLYSLYKQATEGDIRVSRPGMLDMLGRAKWDSWNKQRGVDKERAKGLYVAALLKILRRFTDRASTQAYIEELESFANPLDRPVSPASSSSSYHSSQASPPASATATSYPPPDPNLPAPDVADTIIPPSLLSSSHRSLLNLSYAQSGSLHDQPSGPTYQLGGIIPSSGPGEPSQSLPGSRAHSINEYPSSSRKDSIHSFRRRGPPTPSILGLVPETQQNLNISSQLGNTGGGGRSSRPYTPEPPVTRDYGFQSLPQHGGAPPPQFQSRSQTHGTSRSQSQPQTQGIPGLTPDAYNPTYTPSINTISTTVSPYPQNLHQPIPTYPTRLGPNNHVGPASGLGPSVVGGGLGPAGPGSTSTYNHQPLHSQTNIPQTLQNIQISLTALHERLSSLERSQNALIKHHQRQQSRRGWSFWTSPSEMALDQLDLDFDTAQDRDRDQGGEALGGGDGYRNRVDIGLLQRQKRKSGSLLSSSGLRFRLWWALMKTLRRIMVDGLVGFTIALMVWVIVSRGSFGVGAGLAGGRLRLRLAFARVRGLILGRPQGS